MPWTYRQSTGELIFNGAVVATGYSGAGAGINNNAMQAERNTGPIPVGSYTVGAPFTHPHAGPYTMRLTPRPGTNTFGRAGLMLHGDSRRHPGAASEGCIIENIGARMRVWASQDHVINVVP